MTKLQLRTKEFICLLLMLTSMLLCSSFFPHVRAGTVVVAVSPATGQVGMNVTLTANVTTPNGMYNVTFDGVVLSVGTAIGNAVSTSFIVPESKFGTHNVGVVDLVAGENATGVFSVSTGYSLNTTVPDTPLQLQEGDSVPISLILTGGNASSIVAATVTVQAPNSTSYTKQLNVSTSTFGSGNATLVYPSDFSAGANTNYIGNYNISLDLSNETAPIFMVGLTNSTEYHRAQTVNIRAVYAPNENVTISVSGNNLYNSANVTADSAGMISYSNWTVPTSALAQTQYNVTVVSVSGMTVKSPLDTQNFTVSGFAVNVTAKNLAGETISNVDVRAFENGTSVNNQTTVSTGVAALTLEIGNYTLQGYFNGTRVDKSPSPVWVTNNMTVDMTCNLTNLNIQVAAVVNGTMVGIPEAGIYLSYSDLNLVTDVTGNVVAHSLLPVVAYTLNVSRYNTQFNVTSKDNLLVAGNPVALFNITILCPSYALKVSAFKADGQPFSNAAVDIKELVGGISYDGNTGSDGIVTFLNATFGRYTVEIHDAAGKELNSTTTDLFQDQNVTIHCSLYGLSLKVTVTDYFGQPFASTRVTLQGNGSELVSGNTQADGTVTFENLAGDSFTLSVYLSDNSPPTAVVSLVVDGSTTVPIKMSEYVLFAGFPVEASQLAIVIIIALTLLLILSLEIYRRRRNKSTKVDS